MRKSIIYIAALLSIAAASCTKNFEKINTNSASFPAAEPDVVLPGAMLKTINRMAAANVESLWEYSHLIDPAGRYNPGVDANWNTMYINVLGNTTQLKKLYAGNPAYANRMAITDIWECYVYAYLVGSYGPIPYTHTGETQNPIIPYDDENTVYTSLLSRLKADAAAIKLTGDKFNNDPIYSGDLSKWIKFANSLRLRLALTVQVNLPDLAAANAKELMANEAGLLQSKADAPSFNYGTANGSQSQYNVYLVQTSNTFQGTATPVMSDYLFTYFRSYHDPRVDAYFLKAATSPNILDTLTSTNSALHYIVSYPIPHLGQPKSPALLPQWSLASSTNPTNSIPFGDAKVPVNFSTLQPDLYKTNAPFYLMTYAELCFMKAEASLKGYGGSQSADQYYYAGINANFDFWKLTPAQATAYMAQDGIKWNTEGKGFNYDLGFISTNIPNDNLKRVWIQQWINYFDDGAFDAWVLQRRTQNLVLPPHTSPGAGIAYAIYQNLPDRWQYPVNEAQINPVGVTNAVKSLGATSDYFFTHLKIEPAYTPIDWTKKLPFYDISFVQKWYGTTLEATQAAVGTANVKIISSY